MNGLLLYISEEWDFDRDCVIQMRDFDRDRMIQILSSIDGIYFDNLESAKRDPSIDEIRGCYDYRGYSDDFTFMSASSNFWFRGSGPAAVDLAFRIQQGYPEPIRLIDEGYIFDLVISDFDSADDLSDAMDKASHEAAQEDGDP